MAYEAWVRPDAAMHGRQTALSGSPMPEEHTVRNLFHSIYGRNERAATFREFHKYFKKGYREAAKGKGRINPSPGIRAQVRRLPSGQIQLKLSLKGKNAVQQAQAIRKALGKRVKKAVLIGGKLVHRLHKPRAAKRRKH